MKYLTRLMTAPLVPAVFFFTLPDTSNAYLDPGTGAIIIQAVIGAAVAGSITIAVYWRKVRAFFGNRFRRGKGIEKDNDAAED